MSPPQLPPPNPYTPGELPRLLAGREQQQARIRTQLSRVATFGEVGGPLMVFQGPRGVGKTSLLREAQRDAEEHGFVSAWVAGRKGSPFLPDLVSRVAKALSDAEVTPGGSSWGMRLREVAVELSVPGVAKVSATSVRDDGSPEVTGARVSALEDLLHTASVAVRERGGAGLAVFVDELHAPTRDDLAVFLNAFQNLSGRRQDNPLAIFAGGLPSTASALVAAATFGERSAFHTLPRLDDEAAAEAVRGPAAELGVRWDEDALGAVVRHAQGFPYLLQVHAHATWEVSRPMRGSVLDTMAVRAGEPLVGDQLATLYSARWETASELERLILVAMANADTPDVPRGDIAKALGRPTQSLGVPRNRLIDKGIIEPSGYGRLRFTIPGFDQFVRDLDQGVGTVV